MKTLITFLFLILSVNVNSQVYIVNTNQWFHYSYNEKLSLNKEVDFDSILFNKSFLGNLTYTINLDEKKVKTSEISGWSKNYDILEVIENFSDRTKLLISCGDKKYLMLLEFGQNSLDYFYVERLLSVDNKRIGVYSDELTFITK